MAWPLTPYQTFVANVTTIGSAFLNAVQTAINNILGMLYTFKAIYVDGVGGGAPSGLAPGQVIASDNVQAGETIIGQRWGIAAGFSPITQVGSGPTITVSGCCTGKCMVIKITNGATPASGSLRYQYSVNGGLTYNGADLTVDTSGNDSKTPGTALDFSGTYVTNTTYAFQSYAGFTAPAHLGAGSGVISLGGVCSLGKQYIVLISTGGGLGAGYFKLSTDGGVTYGTATLLPASPGVYAHSSGLVIGFAGTFTLNDTYAFRPTESPLARWATSAGYGLATVDHSGFYGGRLSRLEVNWQWYQIAVNGASTTQLADPSCYLSQTANATYTNGTHGIMNSLSPAFNANCAKILPGTANTNYSYVLTAPTNGIGECVADLSLVMEMEVALNNVAAANNIYWTFGFSSQPTSSLVNLVNGVVFRRRSGDANWQFYVSDSFGTGTASHETYIDTGAAVTALAAYRLRLEYHGTNSPYGQRIRGFINDVLVGEVSGAMPFPAAGATITPQLGGYCNGLPGGSYYCHIGPYRVSWVRWAQATNAGL